MNANFKYQVTDDDRNHLACLFDGKQVKRLATRAEINTLLQACLDKARELDPGDAPASIDSAAGRIIHDIDRGAWSILDV